MGNLFLIVLANLTNLKVLMIEQLNPKCVEGWFGNHSLICSKIPLGNVLDSLSATFLEFS